MDNSSKAQRFRTLRRPSIACAVALLAAMGLRPIPASAANFKFNMVRSPALNAVTDCAPNATGSFSIKPGGPVDTMDVKVKGLPPNTNFDFFVIQVPNGPFGMSWYQGDIETNRKRGWSREIYWPVQYRDLCCRSGNRPCTRDIQQRVSGRVGKSADEPASDVSPWLVVQLPDGRFQCWLPRHCDALQWRAQRRDSDNEYEQLSGPPGTSVECALISDKFSGKSNRTTLPRPWAAATRVNEGQNFALRLAVDTCERSSEESQHR